MRRPMRRDDHEQPSAALRRVHLVHAHPEPKSFVAAMRDTMVAEWQRQGVEVTLSDLYAMGFNPVLSRADFPGLPEAQSDPQGPDAPLTYALAQRTAHGAGGLAPEIAAEVEKVQACDLLAFTFPLFWFDVPAILKGWIDRVFLSGPFYGGRRIYARGGLAGKRAFAAFSLGGREHMFGPGALHGELETGMMRSFFQGTLGYVGLAVHQPFTAYHVPYLDDAARRGILDDLRGSITALGDRPVLPMPDLGAYDERFRPLS